MIRTNLTALLLLSSTLVGCGPDVDLASQTIEQALRDDHLAEARYRPSYLKLATGTPEQAATRRANHPWPQRVLSIGHSTASYQNYGGAPYFHHGLDIRGDAGSDVVAAAGGKVVNIENYMSGPAYWEVAILDDEGFLWQYHHVDRDSIPRAIHDAFRSGEKIAAGTKIGEIYYWSVVTYGERYHHVHLNVLGAGGVYLNPFNFLEPLADHQAPQIAEIGLLQAGRPLNRTSVQGEYGMYAIVHDLILHDKFVVPPHSLSYAIDGGPQINVWNFDTLPGGTSNERYVHDFFVPSVVCGNYTCRKLAINLGFGKNGNRSFANTPGAHSITLEAKDVAGNSVQQDFTWTVEQ